MPPKIHAYENLKILSNLDEHVIIAENNFKREFWARGGHSNAASFLDRIGSGFNLGSRATGTFLL